MKRILSPLLLLALLGLACQFGGLLPAATPSAIPDTLPPTVEPATATIVGPTETTAAPTEASATEPPESATPGSQTIRVVVRLADDTVTFVDTGFAAGSVRLNQGLLPKGGAAQGAAYVLDFNGPTTAQQVDANGTKVLPFVENPTYGLAVSAGDGPGQLKLAWGTALGSDPPSTQLVIATPNPGGFDVAPVLTEAIGDGQPPYQLVAQFWSADGQSLYYSREPVGIGGYILFGGATSLYRYNLADRSVAELIPFDINTGMICLDDLNADLTLAAGHCGDPKTITLRDLAGGPDQTITAPGTVTDFNVVGSARFSPDGQRVAFALAKGVPDAEQGYVAVSDGLGGASNFVATTDPGSYYTVLAWLDDSTLLLQLETMACNPTCESSLWTIGIGGDNLTKLSDGRFLALRGGD
jgi:hypothetical protein